MLSHFFFDDFRSGNLKIKIAAALFDLYLGYFEALF
jgi:hypothetical protein